MLPDPAHFDLKSSQPTSCEVLSLPGAFFLLELIIFFVSLRTLFMGIINSSIISLILNTCIPSNLAGYNSKTMGFTKIFNETILKFIHNEKAHAVNY